MNTNDESSPPPVASSTPQVAVLTAAETTNGHFPATKRITRRNGRIARLPKLQRDMVCRMLRDGVPYKHIVGALREHGITVTQRNVSNFKTRGGYDDWRLEQERVLETHLAQEALSDYLAETPNELPEVGLQVAATLFSKHLLRPDIQQKLESQPEQFVPLISSLCRLSKEILNLHKFRDVRRSFGSPGFRQEHQKLEEKKDLEKSRAVYTRPATGPDTNVDNGVQPALRQR